MSFLNTASYESQIQNFASELQRADEVKDAAFNAKDRANKIILFDDYHLPGKTQKDMDVSNVVDGIEDYEKTLIKMDRRIFFDDRRVSDADLDYGQVLIIKE